MPGKLFAPLAGKLDALLCRGYSGRDWHDFIWYTALRTAVDRQLLSSVLDRLGPWRGRQARADRGWCVERLRAKIEATDWKQAGEDVRRFVKPDGFPSLDLRGREFLLAQCDKLA